MDLHLRIFIQKNLQRTALKNGRYSAIDWPTGKQSRGKQSTAPAMETPQTVI